MDDAARNQIVEQHPPLARSVVTAILRTPHLPISPDEREDMFQVAVLAMIVAVPHYDPRHKSGAGMLHFLHVACHNALCNWLDRHGRIPVPIGTCVVPQGDPSR